MTILIVHNRVVHDDPASLDTLEQASFVQAALQKTGQNPTILEASANLEALAKQLTAHHPDLVFNLVESWQGEDRLSWLPVAAMEGLGLPHTGASAAALQRCADKPLLNSLLHGLGIAVPPCWQVGTKEGLYIVKSTSEHASKGLDDGNVVRAINVPAIIAQKQQQYGGHWFAERYIDGREFNISILQDSVGNPQVLSIPETLFEGYTEQQVRVVGHAAKWQEDSYAYHHTPRRFDFPASDANLLENLATLAETVWRYLGLSGYARIDVRVAANNTPYVIDVNPNPCLSPDAGFMAAAAQAGLTPFQVLERITGQ